MTRAEAAARRTGEGYGTHIANSIDASVNGEMLRERAIVAREFDPAELHRGRRSVTAPSIIIAALPLVVVVLVDLSMSIIVLPRLNFSFLAEERWGGTSISAVAGVWSVVVALAAAIAAVVLCNSQRLLALRQSMDAGANASVLPVLSVASLVGFGAVVAGLPAFAMVRDWSSRLREVLSFRSRSQPTCSPR
jgi:H+/gluconate symporter-like permease